MIRPRQDAPAPGATIRAGLFADPHYADHEPKDTRFYRQSIRKLREALETFCAEAVDFVVEMGDFIDSGETPEHELSYLKQIEAVYRETPAPRYYALGNHCVEALTKEQFFAHTAMSAAYYRFERGAHTFIVLDACYSSEMRSYGGWINAWDDANIPPEELAWLERELACSPAPVIVFVHQRLDIEGDHAVNNAPEVRAILEASGKVRAVIQAHHHLNALERVNGIPYCTLAAMIDGGEPHDNAYAILDINGDGAVRIRGYGNQASWEL